MPTNTIVETLSAKGNSLFDSPVVFEEFTKNKCADTLLNNLTDYPHAFVLACVMDRQIKAEKAWMIPYLIAEKLGGFEFERLVALSMSEVEEYMTKPVPLHRFTSIMSNCFYLAIGTIADKYSGNASRIWEGQPSSAEVIYRFLEFEGIGQKIGTMAANILARNFKVKFADYYSIDISVDVHVKRVFYRLGLIPKNSSNEQVIYRARALSPTFPGLLDLPAWEIGRNWCKPSEPLCTECYMNQVCPKIM